MVPLWNPHWDPTWKAAADTNLPVHFHTITPPAEAPLPKDAPEQLVLMNKAARMAKFGLGADTVMWASDYPHGDSVFPDSQQYISRQCSSLLVADRRKVTCENAGRFYGLM